MMQEFRMVAVDWDFFSDCSKKNTEEDGMLGERVFFSAKFTVEI